MTLVGHAEEDLWWHGPVLASQPSDRPARTLFEGNRSVIVRGADVICAGRTLHLSVKGVGAAASMYGAHPFREAGAPRTSRRITRELWMGEAPYGGQGEAGGTSALELSRSIDGVSLAGAHLCPTLALHEVPETLIDPELRYRRYDGRVLQEQRLVPSDVRLFAGSERTLGVHADEVLHAFDVRTPDALEAFVEQLLRTGAALLTLFARTLKQTEPGPVGLDFDDVWLDKDAVLAPDGALFFVDLEALEWTPAWPSVEARVRRQLGRNAYELSYALDVLLDVRERWRDRRASASERRAVLGALMPSIDDTHVRATPARGAREGGWDWVVAAGGTEVVVPFLDPA